MVHSNGGGEELEVMSYRREGVEANAALFVPLRERRDLDFVFHKMCVNE